MASEDEIWRPGSFTKNFSWGHPPSGLGELHEIIRVGFDNEMKDVPRHDFRARIEHLGKPVYIPLNFFLFNKPIGGVDHLCADELVFQALNWEHNRNFDKLALFAFLLSLAGRWNGSKSYQRRPALWANAYIREHVSKDFGWDTRQVSANDIQRFLQGEERYDAKTSRKVSTNLNYMFSGGHLAEFSVARIERWWVDCLFLALDRIIEDRLLDRKETKPTQYVSLLDRYNFVELTGKKTLEKTLATKHLVELYTACGGRDRFSEDATQERIRTLRKQLELYAASPNDSRPRGAIHPTNPRILKSIPSACAMLAKYAGFEVITPDQMAEFDLEEFVRQGTQAALAKLREDNIKPTMTAEEIMRITRER
ncbi:hypothetical protein Kim5_CH00754 [Rhizobium sp. Kim5]|uniref:hypothetical protein n=1 Tax=Rhizobium sp. Kim5 TaxID=2020311 RepID=UPI000A2A1665|nr:hypothetical protein [Rhizobium sp. Kim5]ARQ56862.1 hypothetical protein Kim5_CH00754 [Rhizobium sp. Kim5]